MTALQHWNLPLPYLKQCQGGQRSSPYSSADAIEHSWMPPSGHSRPDSAGSKGVVMCSRDTRVPSPARNASSQPAKASGGKGEGEEASGPAAHVLLLRPPATIDTRHEFRWTLDATDSFHDVVWSIARVDDVHPSAV
nr:hypothetical protein CFP56_29971 [Quercus suber]